MFHRLSKHLEVSSKLLCCVVFSTVFLVFGYPDETVSLVFDILFITLTLAMRLSRSSSTSGDHALMSFWVCWLMLTTVSWPICTPISGNSSMKPWWRKDGHCWTLHSTVPAGVVLFYKWKKRLLMSNLKDTSTQDEKAASIHYIKALPLTIQEGNKITVQEKFTQVYCPGFFQVENVFPKHYQ